MKIVWCTCNISSVDQLTEIIDKSGISSYQLFPEVTGKSNRGLPRMDSPVWPGHNAVLTAQIGDEVLATFTHLLSNYNKSVLNEDELIFAWAWEISTVV
jgi:hypothetical protein